MLEIVDPRTRRPVPDGTPGEIVFTTLTREGMPLIRYSTGDHAAFKREACPCGTALRTLGTVQGRWHDRLLLGRNTPLLIGHLDEAVFGVDGVFNDHVELRLVKGTNHLILMIDTRETKEFPPLAERIRRAVVSLPAVRTARATGRLAVDIRPVQGRLAVAVSSGASKRRILDLRERSA